MYFYDLSGNICFEIHGCTADSFDGFQNGYTVLNFCKDYFQFEFESKFVDMSGNIAFPEIAPWRNFENGISIAEDNMNRIGVFSVEGTWIIPPQYTEISQEGNFYIASDDSGYTIYNLNGTVVAYINGIPQGDQYLQAYQDQLYWVGSNYDKQGQYVSTYTDAFTNQLIKCKKTGSAVTSHFYDTPYFYYDDGSYTYIVDFNGNTLATLDGVGTPERISEEFFSFSQGDWMEGGQTYSIYSFQAFQKLWSENLNKQTSLWAINEKYVVRDHYPENPEYYDFMPLTYDILDLSSGKPIVEGIIGYDSFTIEDQVYLSYTDGVYTYTISPDGRLLMKNRNNTDD